MELLPRFSAINSIPPRPPLSTPPPSNSTVYHHCRYFFRQRLNHRSKPNRFHRLNCSSNSITNISSRKRLNCRGSANFLAESEEKLVDVISIGSRKDAVIDFCLDSPFQLSSSLRFWNFQTKDSAAFQLRERMVILDDEGGTPRVVEAKEFLTMCSKAIILVASAGYGLEHITAIDILKTIRSKDGFVVAIFLKPFSFEGQRRQDEVTDLVEKLQVHTNFCIDIDTDALLKKDLVTLDEALKTANSAVLLAINAISVLISDMHRKIIDVKDNNVKELKVSEVIKILESYKEAKIGFGAGNSIESSVKQALYDCPFIGASVEDLNGIVICIIASSGHMDNKDVQASLLTFHQTSKYMGKIIICTAHEPDLEPNVLVTTIVIVGCTEQRAPQKSSLLSRLAQHFPFVFKLLRIPHQQSSANEGNDALEGAHLSKVIDSPNYGAMENGSSERLVESFDRHSDELERVSSSDYDDIYSSSGVEEDEGGSLETRTESFNIYNENMEGTTVLQREPVVSRNLGPGYQIAQEWAKERTGTTLVLNDLSIFQLPVGVRPSEELKGSLNVSYTAEFSEPNTEDNFKGQTLANSSISSWGALSNFYNNASTLLKGRSVDVPKKQGILSVRAASMLEAERDSPKKWSPITEMQYRGGVYRGRCQGGLPEGKGCLILGDGSMYDGMWRYGKRSGPGTFYFSNGDVFQGSWRDDVMHGKGWFYFHTGDRWFANFWKGKANGASRFYSRSGDVFFGHFQDGWRHGHFLCISVDGTRCVETWDEGVLVNREQLASDTGGG